MNTCPNGHPTPKEFAPGTQIRCPYTKDGINCDALYVVGEKYADKFSANRNPAQPAPQTSTRTRSIG